MSNDENALGAEEHARYHALVRLQRRLRFFKWFGATLVVVPFAALVTYELLFEKVGPWRYLLLGSAFIGAFITFVSKALASYAQRKFNLDISGDT